MTLYYPPTTNALQKTLGAQLDQGTTASATLNNTTGIQNKPGVMLIDRVDSNGNLKSSSNWEWVIYQGTSGSTVTSLTRGVGGSSDQDHAVGAIVEFVMDISWAQGIIDTYLTEHGTDGTHDNTKVAMLAGTQTLSDKTLEDATLTSTSNGNISISPNGTGVIQAKTTVQLTAFGPTTDTATGDGKAGFRVPAELAGMNLVKVAACVTTAGTTNTTIVQVRNATQAADMLSTRITIDSGETDTATAATAAVIDTANDDVAEGDQIYVDVDQVSTTAAKGLMVQLTFATP